MITMALSRSAKSSVNRLCSLLAFAIIFLFLINIIITRLLWYMFLFSQNWPSELKLELHLGANTILYKSIMFLLDNKIEIVSIFSVYITCSAIVTKLMLLAIVFKNSFHLLYK